MSISKYDLKQKFEEYAIDKEVFSEDGQKVDTAFVVMRDIYKIIDGIREEEVIHKEEIIVSGFGQIVNDLDKIDLLDVVEFRIKNILMSDLHSISLNNTTLSELIKLRDQLRP